MQTIGQVTMNTVINVQFALTNNNYKEYFIDTYKLPIPKDYSCRYDNYKLNEHHYITKYHREIVLPKILKLMDIDFNLDDFKLIELYDGIYDLSYLLPINETYYEVYDYVKNETVKCTANELINTHITNDKFTKYHMLYRFQHQCSVIHNKNAKTNKTVFISGDSQMIPSIVPISYYFKTVYYCDNRTAQSIDGSYSYEKTTQYFNNQIYTDYGLIAFYDSPIEKYLKINFK